MDSLDIEVGDAGQLDTQGTGWFVGFGPWTQVPGRGARSLRFMPEASSARGLCVKWMRHPAGDPRGRDKPVSVGRTLSILVDSGGRFRLELSAHADFPAHATRRCVLERPGQFCAWGPGLHHRYEVDAECTVLTVRWVPAEPEAAPVAAAATPDGAVVSAFTGRGTR